MTEVWRGKSESAPAAQRNSIECGFTSIPWALWRAEGAEDRTAAHNVRGRMRHGDLVASTVITGV